jgi:hypothetical protein
LHLNKSIPKSSPDFQGTKGSRRSSLASLWHQDQKDLGSTQRVENDDQRYVSEVRKQTTKPSTLCFFLKRC